MEHKICPKCERDLPLSEYHRRGDGHGDGHFTHCRDCENERGRLKYHRDVEKQRERGRLKQQKLKIEIFDHYGRFCVCCGESELVFLALDHINGKGTAHRKAVKAGSGSFYNWIKKQDFPEGFQTLCHNCNWAKHHGGCPHQLPLPQFEIVGKGSCDHLG